MAGCGLCLFLGLGAVVEQAHALMVVQGTGNITFVDSDLAGAGIAGGDTFTFEITIDDTVADILTSTSNGYFFDAIQAMTFVIGGYTLDLTGGDVSVRDFAGPDILAFNSFDEDQLFSVSDINGLPFQRASVEFRNGDPISGDSLTIALNNISGFADTDLYFDYGNNIIRGVITSVTTSVGSVIDIPDANLRSALEVALGLNPGDPITQAAMEGLTSIDLTAQGIADLSGLENAISLTSLNISANAISDFNPLSGLANLQYLDLSGNQATAATGLGTLTSLIELDVSNNQLQDISALAELTPSAAPDLRLIWLHDNLLTDVSALSGLSQLANVNDPWFGSYPPDNANAPGLRLELNALDIADGSTTRTAVIDPLQTIAGLDVLYTPQKTPAFEVPQPLVELYGLEGDLLTVEIEVLNTGSASFDLSLSASPAWVSLVGEPVTVAANSSALVTLSVGPLPVFTEPLQAEITFQSTDALASGETVMLEIFEGRMIEIPDAALQQRIYNALRLEEDDILTQSLIEELTSLSVFGAVEDLTGLEYAINLSTLTLGGIPAGDLSPVLKLPALRTLSLSNLGLETVPDLQNLTELQVLSLANNDLKNLDGLIGLPNLTRLILSGNPITSFEALQGRSLNELRFTGSGLQTLDGLTSVSVNWLILSGNSLTSTQGMPQSVSRLELSGNMISDLTGLAGLTLSRLDLSDNQVTDLTPLETVAIWSDLDLSNNQIEDISPIRGMTGLSTLDLSNNSIESISGFEAWNSLRTLNLVGNPLSGTVDLTGFPGLDSLNLTGAQMTAVPDLTGLVNLRSLRLIQTKIASLVGVAELPALTSLDVTGSRLQNLDGLAAFPSLTLLRVRSNNLTDITGLQEVPQLTTADLWGNAIQTVPDLSGLSSLRDLRLGSNELTQLSDINAPALEVLDVSANGLTTLADLGPQPNLKQLSASDNLLQAIDLVAEHVPSLTGIGLWSNRISDLSGLANLPNLTGELNLRWNQISTLDTLPTSGLPGVSGLNLQDNPLQSLQGIGRLSSLSTLNISGTGIIDLGGIEEATGLTTLSAWSNRITDLTPLQSLSNLSSLSVGGNQIQDLSPIANLPLTVLRADDNQLTSLPVLNTTLTYLGLKQNQLTDITPLAGLVNLSTLQLSDNLIQDLNPLSGLAKLNRLEINDNLLQNLDGLPNPSQLDWLFATNNFIADISGLTQQKELGYLYLSGNSITSLAGLSDLPELRYLILDSNQISNLSGLELVPKLSLVRLQNNSINTIEALRNLPSITDLNVSGNQISDLSPLADMPSLQTLNISENPIGSGLSALAGSNPIDFLRADNAGIDNLSGIEGLTLLAGLRLDDNSITDIQPLANLPNLKSLSIDGNPIGDFAPLNTMPSLTFLSIESTGASDLSFLAGNASLSTLRASNNGIGDISPMASMPCLQRIWLNRNNITDLSPLGSLMISELQVSENLITDLTPIGGQSNLQQLDISQNSVVDLSAVPTLSLLKSLRAAGNEIATVPDLRPLKELSYVDLSENNIQNPEFLGALPSMMTLKLGSNQINTLENFTGELKAGGVQFLVLSNNAITDIQPLGLLKDLQLVWLDNNFVSDPSVLQSLPNLADARVLESGSFHWNLVPGQPQVAGVRLQGNYIDISEDSVLLALLEDMDGRADLTVEFTPQYAPDLSVSPISISFLGEPGGNYTQTLNLRNFGTGILEYEITFPPEATWLDIPQPSGTIAELGSMDVTLNFGPLPAFDKLLETTLTITTNEPGGTPHELPVRVVGLISNPDYSSAVGDFQLIEAGPQWRTEVRDGTPAGDVLVGTYRSDGGGWVPYFWDAVNGIRNAPQIPGAITRSSFVLVQEMSEAAQLAVGRSFDEFGNLVPVVWSLEEPLAPPTILPLPDGVDRTGFSNLTIGRAFAISGDGIRISGQALNGAGILEGILWRWDESTSAWTIERRTGDFAVGGSNFLEVWPYELSADGETVIGWVSYFDLNFNYIQFPFMWTESGIDYLPVPLNAQFIETDLISANGKTVLGQYYDPGPDENRLIIWSENASGGTWSYDTFSYPTGFFTADPESFINDHSTVVSLSLLADDRTVWRSFIFDSTVGFVPTRDWILDKFGIDFGPDWEGDVHFANPATGVVFGKVSPLHSNRYQWMGFRYDRFGDVQNSLADAPFLADLPPGQQGPGDTNGPLSISNELAYALGLHPFHATPDDMPQLVIEESGGNQFLAKTSPYNENATDVEVIAEVSSTMLPGDWHQDPANVEVVRDGNGNLIARDKIPLSPENPRFIRLRVVPRTDTPSIPEGFVLVEGGTLSTTNALNGTEVATFLIAKYEVTWGEWQEVRTWAAANGYDIGSRGAGCFDDHPVTSVSWYDVVKWCNAKSQMEGLTPVYTVSGSVYRSGESDDVVVNASANGNRLPLEAEWEFAARGGNQTNDYTYAGSNDLNEVGWYTENSDGATCPLTSGRGTWPVGQKVGNELGLFDMSGNVLEWCWDNRLTIPARRIRGGGWISSASSCSVSYVMNGSPDFGGNHFGFRLARSSAD